MYSNTNSGRLLISFKLADLIFHPLGSDKDDFNTVYILSPLGCSGQKASVLFAVRLFPRSRW